MNQNKLAERAQILMFFKVNEEATSCRLWPRTVVAHTVFKIPLLFYFEMCFCQLNS